MGKNKRRPTVQCFKCMMSAPSVSDSFGNVGPSLGRCYRSNYRQRIFALLVRVSCVLLTRRMYGWAGIDSDAVAFALRAANSTADSQKAAHESYADGGDCHLHRMLASSQRHPPRVRLLRKGHTRCPEITRTVLFL